MKTLIMTKKSQTGLSLIEIQVALVIGLILTAGAAQLFISNQQTYRSESALSRMQQSGRFIVETIANDIRMVGFTGCASREGNAPVTDNTTIVALPYPIVDANSNLTNVIAGTDGQGGVRDPVLPVNLNSATIATILPATDTITIQRANQCGAAVTTTTNPGASINVFAPNQCNFRNGQGAIITNCVRSDIFDIQAFADNGNSQDITPNAALSQAYADDAFVYQFLSNTYYIAPSQIDLSIPVANREPALWVDQWDPSTGGYNSIELADGVEDLEILYGVDTGGDTYPDTYQAVDAALDMSTVRSVRINLLLRSADGITTQAGQTVFFDGGNIPAPADRRLRTVYSSTISIRNQLP